MTCVVLLGPSQQAVSGVSTHLRHLCNSELQHTIRFLHFRVGSEGVPAETRLARVIRILFGPLKFSCYVHGHAPDIVHINTSLRRKSYWRDLVFLAVARLFGAKVVYQVHGGALPADFFPGNGFLGGILRWTLKAADVVVLLADFQLTAYRAFAPEARLEVIPNGIDVTGLSGERSSAKATGPLRLIYLGRLVRTKGLFEMLEAVTLLTEEGRDVELTVAGSGPDEDELRARAGADSLRNRVHFVGPIFDEAKNHLLCASHVFLFPTYDEGMPYALLEAMAAGAVPVTTPVGGIPDIVTDGVHGFLVAPRDPVGLAAALRVCDDDRSALARMAAAGRERINSNFTITRLADRFRYLYESLAPGQ
jgi:glycosyltransferase involved in cell wall biosynthesis